MRLTIMKFSRHGVGFLVLLFAFMNSAIAEDLVASTPPKTLKEYIADELASMNTNLQSAVADKRYKEAADLHLKKSHLTMAQKAADLKAAALAQAEGQQDFATCAALVDEMQAIPRTYEGLKAFAAIAEKEAAAKEKKEAANKIMDKSQNTGLILAAKTNDVSRAREYIALGADLDKVNDEGMTALIMCARKGHVEVAQLLVDAGANKVLTDRGQRTALMWAAEEGNIEVAKLVVDAGASKDSPDGRQGWRNALMWAAEEGHVEVAKLLIDAGANRAWKYPKDNTRIN